MGPQPMQPLSTSSSTDPDTAAIVTARSDLVMVINYVSGDRVVQDSDGTRVTSYASGGFLVESAGLPNVRKDAGGVAVEPMPGNFCDGTASRGLLVVETILLRAAFGMLLRDASPK